MSLNQHLGKAALLAVVAAGFVGQAVLAGSAGAATVSKAELKGTQLRLEGRAPSGTSFVQVESTTSATRARPDVSGTFKAQSDAFTAPDCRVVVNDFHNPLLTVTLSGCTPSVKPVGTPAPPSGSCVITPQSTPTNLTLNAQSAFTFAATGCSQSSPIQYTVVAGVIPTGMSVGGPQNAISASGNIIGTPTVRGTYRFTIQVTDAAGATDQENFTINVV